MTNEEFYWLSRNSIEIPMLQERAEMQLFSMLRPPISADGNQWCVLYGDDLQSSIAGFGDSPYLAVLDFNRAFNKILNKPQP